MEITLVRAKITLCVCKSHYNCRNHTLLIEITLLHVIIVFVRVKITLVCVEITLAPSEITLMRAQITLFF
jgi:hypothetical protein